VATTKVLDAALARAREDRDADLKDLIDELRIPSIAALPKHYPDCVRNAEWLQDRFERLGMKAYLARPVPDGIPVVVAEWNGAPGKPHLTIYGHYDVQPADPLDRWETPPFEPAIRNGHVYARGAADSKGNHLASVKAVEHLLAAGGLPVNVRFIIEGEEEVTGPSLPRFVRDSASKLATDAVLVWDGGFDEVGRPTLATGLRGMLYVELHAKGAAHDLHSGTYGGLAPNPINTLARILGELKDREGHVTIPGFYDAVRGASAQELADWRPEDGRYAAEMQRMAGARALEGEPGFLANERTGTRPTLDVHGILGGFVGEGQKTVIPSQAFAKVSMRLVPDQDYQAIFDSLDPYVRSLSTPGVEVRVEMLSPAPPFTTGVDNPAARALVKAFKETFGKETAFVRVGGSIPAALDFHEALGAPIVISGIDEADTSIHSPNEHFSVEQYHRGIEALIRFICHFAAET
jgi:acetylornithine deacetylase/succinyl-diaminopimelate desuccinylase-like protein